VLKAFQAEEAKKSKSDASQRRTSNRTARSSLSSPKTSINKNERHSRSSNRSSSTRQHRKRTSSDENNFTEDEDEDEDEDDNDNGYSEKKLSKSASSKRSRKSTTDTDTSSSLDSHGSDLLDTAKLDHIIDIRRNKKTNTVEYHIQIKKIKTPGWIQSDRLTEDYTQEVVDFLEEKYV
jgi:hypothetical protein